MIVIAIVMYSDRNDKSSENNDDSDDEYIKLRPKTLEELIQERNIIDENYGMISENEKSLNQYAKEKLENEKDKDAEKEKENLSIKFNLKMNITIIFKKFYKIQKTT